MGESIDTLKEKLLDLLNKQKEFNKEIDSLEACWKDCRELLFYLNEENKKLRNAINLIIECGVIEYFDHTKESMFDNGSNLANAKAVGNNVITDNGGCRRVAIECKYSGMSCVIAHALNSIKKVQDIMKQGA